MPRGKRGRGSHGGFRSKAQMRFFFANPKLRRYARKKAHKSGMHSAVTKRLGYSPAYRRLPARRGVKRRAR